MGAPYTAVAATSVVGHIYGCCQTHPQSVGFKPAPPTEPYTCAYCRTPRYDKAHNCRNCAGLEVIDAARS